MRPINAPVGDRQVARARQSLSLLREADGFFNIGRKLDWCPRTRDTSELRRVVRAALQITGFNEIPLVGAHLRFSFVDLWCLAVLFILAIHGSTSVW